MGQRSDLQVTTPKDVESCVGCRYAQPVVTQSENVILECYRYPAQILVWEGEIFQAHPDAVYRCGEYKRPHEEVMSEAAGILRTMREGALEARARREGSGDGSSTHPSSS
jgi:hypothetical protein